MAMTPVQALPIIALFMLGGPAVADSAPLPSLFLASDVSTPPKPPLTKGRESVVPLTKGRNLKGAYTIA